MLRSHRFEPVQTRRGSALAVLGISLVVIVGVMAVVLDGGVLMAERRHGQSVADASAMAAACSLYSNYATNNGLDPSGTAATAARAIASDNGYNNDGVTSTVTVNIPPLTGSFIGKSGYVEVNVQYNQARCFSALWGAGTMSVTARSVARGQQAPYSGAGILLLDPSASQTLLLSGGSSLTTNATVVVDSTSASAVYGSGSANLNVTELDDTGGISWTSGNPIVGTKKTGTPAVADPLASLPVPPTGPTQSSSSLSISSTVVLNPGLYVGGIAMMSGASVTLNPGIYYMKGGGFDVKAGASLVGNGVMIYNDPASSSDDFTVNGSGTLTLSPPTSGTYAGITAFQNRTATTPAAISGGSTADITGTFYFAGARLTVSGGAALSQLGSQYISKDLSVTGSGVTNLSWGSGNVARKRTINLVE